MFSEYKTHNQTRNHGQQTERLLTSRAAMGAFASLNLPEKEKSRRPATTAAHALAALLLLTALWPLGSRAGDAGQTTTSAALPASLQGQWVPTSKGLESAGALTLDARTLRWPLCGKARRRIDPRITDGGQPTDFPAFNAFNDPPQAMNSGPQALIDLTAHGAPPCKLDGLLVTHLRLKPGTRRDSISSSACEIEVTLYGTRPQPAGPQQLEWGTFTDKRWFANKRCPVEQAPPLGQPATASRPQRAG
jgi:hypothetical protein